MSEIIITASADKHPPGAVLDHLVVRLLQPPGVEPGEGEGAPTWRPVGTYWDSFRPSADVAASDVVSKAIERLGPPEGVISNDGPWWMGQWRPHLHGSRGYVVGWCCHPGGSEEWYQWATGSTLPHAICLAGLVASSAPRAKHL